MRLSCRSLPTQQNRRIFMFSLEISRLRWTLLLHNLGASSLEASHNLRQRSDVWESACGSRSGSSSRSCCAMAWWLFFNEVSRVRHCRSSRSCLSVLHQKYSSTAAQSVERWAPSGSRFSSCTAHAGKPYLRRLKAQSSSPQFAPDSRTGLRVLSPLFGCQYNTTMQNVGWKHTGKFIQNLPALVS